MATRIELDTKALASIIGGDSEVELHLRKQIVCEFARQYLVKLVKDESFKIVADEVKNNVRDILHNECGIGDKYILSTFESRQAYIRDKIKELIKDAVEREIFVAKQQITSYLDKWILDQKEAWKGFATRSASSTIKEEVRKGVMKALEGTISTLELE